MTRLDEMLSEIQLPKMVRIRQINEEISIDNVNEIIVHELTQTEILEKLKPGMRIAVGVGSRGIDRYAEIAQAVISFLKRQGIDPFIVPAMGSHGNATAEGQIAVLASLGITEEAVGCPIISDMRTVCIGRTEDGTEIHIDYHAAEADGIILINRIKRHTSFVGRYESGLMKMAVIGLGKQYGAQRCHRDGFAHMAERIEEFGNIILRNTPILIGLALIENANEKLCMVKAIPAERIPNEEPNLLEFSKSIMAKIPYESSHVLVVDTIGKDISGAGLDPSTVGRFQDPAGISREYCSFSFRCERMVTLRMSEASHGNFCGIGLGDVTTGRIVHEADHEATYLNCFTSRQTQAAYIPPYFESDQAAIKAGIYLSSCHNPKNVRLIIIRSTLALDTLEISEALIPEAKETENIEIVSELYELEFDESGNRVEEQICQ